MEDQKMKSYRLLASALFTVMVAGGSAFGADSNNLLLDEIIVKGQKESPREESLTIREVRESPARDMGEALKAVDGVSIVRKGAIANDVVIRGLQKDNINVFLDGVRLHGACPNRMDPPSFHYDFAEVEQVKVIKGPYDLANPGSLGGVIEAVSKKPNKGWGADFSATGGSYDSVNTSAVGSYGGDTFDALLGYAFKYSGVPVSGNGKHITEIYPETSANRYKEGEKDGKAYLMNTAWTKWGYNISENSRTEIGYSFQDAEHILYPYLLMDAVNDRTNRVNWTYNTQKLSPLVKDAKLQFYWDKVTHLMNDQSRVSSNTMPRTYSMQTDASTQVIGAKASSGLSVGTGQLNVGIDYYNRNWDATNVRRSHNNYAAVNMIPNVYIDNVGLFTEYVVPFGERVILSAGARGDLTWAKADKSPIFTQTGSTDFANVSANAQLTYKPIDGLETYFGLGRGTRTPDPQELFMGLPTSMGKPGSQGNVNLHATANNQMDVGIKYNTDKFYANGSFFYGYLTDFINIYQMNATYRSYQNVNATMWGYEFSSQYSLPLDLFLKGSLSYTWGDNRDKHQPLSEMPPLHGNVGIRYDNNAFFFEAVENLSSKQERTDASLQELPTAGYVATDLKTGFRYEKLAVYGGVNNLFDIQYYNYLSYQRDPFASGLKVPENGRNFYLTVQYTF